MRNLLALLMVAVFLAAGCSKPIPQKQAASESPQAKDTVVQPVSETTAGFQPFIVYKDKGSRDNHFIPSGFMPNGKCHKLEDAWLENCHDGKTCMKIIYDVVCSAEDQKWAGIYWLNPANNWGNRKGGFNLTGAQKLTFWARGEKGGERIEEFKIGGITGDFPDTDMAIIGPVILTADWQQYTIDLRGKDLSYMSGGFSWSTNVEVNPQECTFYLDDVQYE